MAKRKYRTIETDIFGFEVKDAPINSKRKGDRNERNVAKLLSDWVGVPFTRVPRSGGLRWKNTANVCGDVVCEVQDFDFPFSVETKHLKKIKVSYNLRKNSIIYKIFEQAVDDAKRSEKRPLVIVRENNMPKDDYYVFIEKDIAGIIDENLVISVGSCLGKDIVGFTSKDFFAVKFDKFKKFL